MTTQRSSSRRAWWAAATVMVVALGSLAIGWTLANRVARTPAQLVADASPPTAEPITAAVEQRVLSENIVARGQVAPADEFAIFLPAAGEVAPIVTATPLAVGQSVANGEIILEVAGRPVIALRGPFPLYRDLMPGDEGVDVSMVQEALRSVGYRIPSTESGRFARGTQEAVAEMWRDRGHEPSERKVIEQPSTGSLSQTELSGAAMEDQSNTSSIGTRTEVVLLRSEVAMIPALPANVVGLHVGVGEQLSVERPVLSVTTWGLVLKVPLDGPQLSLVRKGMSGAVDDSTTGLQVPLVVAAVFGQTSGSQDPGGSDPASSPLAVLVPSEPFDATLLGADLRLRIETVASDEAVLAVPVTAVRSHGDGSQYVLVSDGPSKQLDKDEGRSTTRDVTVETGPSAGGWVEVSASRAAQLVEGDRVVVG